MASDMLSQGETSMIYAAAQCTDNAISSVITNCRLYFPAITLSFCQNLDMQIEVAEDIIGVGVTGGLERLSDLPQVTHLVSKLASWKRPKENPGFCVYRVVFLPHTILPLSHLHIIYERLLFLEN